MKSEDKAFCREYLKTMDPEIAGGQRRDGFSILGRKDIREKLEKMRANSAIQIRREDVLRRLAQLAFGQANDVVSLALRPQTAEPGKMDLSAVSELKVTEKGVEVKLVDRVRALETLWNMLGTGEDSGAEELYRALEEAASQLEACNE